MLLFAAAAADAQRTPLIGIYEGFSSGAGDNQGQPGIRVLFYQSGSQWRSYNAACKDEACLKTISSLFPQTTQWTLIKGGRSIAQVTAHTPAAFRFYSEIGVQAVTTPIANPEPRPSQDQPDPPHTILATTLPILADPDNWRSSAVFPLDLTHVRQVFRKLFPHPRNCTQISANSPATYRDWTYKDTDIALNASYLSARNWRLLQVTLGPYRCDGPPDADFADHWFAISPTGEVRPIGRLMHLAGAGDFGRQGRSELLFSSQDPNEGGYKLFYDNFSRQASAVVTFH
jgi:hypothetical protein